MLFRVMLTAAAFTAVAYGAMAQEAETTPATPTVETTTPATTTPATDATKALDPNQRICKRTETTGSRLGGRMVCMTRAEWRAEAERAREAIRKMQNGPTMQCGTGSSMGCGG